ncbi:OLC1v1027865C1 [Oldenlandia corymbosa var. corymbosa]|uniref:OLC1v1027865C1 n=1 Tax=Oldenlandia corymbosa var. corymbosa TaxID=529605 RepID=A0AAV1CAP3_OLDCO|nr:OLC1v1027865C1 [Oldenlandia corymbosa var. corymbosa]
MVSDPNLIYYACVARGTIILAEFNSKHADLGSLARECLGKTPPLHSVFSHTVRQRTYTFLIEDPFVYFAIFDEKLENSEGLAFLKGVKEAFNDVAGTNSGKKRLEHLSSHSFQGEFNPVFHQLLTCGDLDAVVGSPSGVQSGHGRNVSTDSSVTGGGSVPVGMPLLANGSKNLTMKKKKRFLLGGCLVGPGGNEKDEKSVKALDGSDDGLIGLSSEFRVVMSNKNGLYAAGEMGHQKAKKVWKKHVWVVLSMDLIICTILFVVWLCICRGFKCIDS